MNDGFLEDPDIMEIKELKINGVFEITLNPIFDSRGFFMRVYDKALFRSWNIDKEWVQENHSHSEKKGIIRGLHLQLPPFDETKLVRCIHGSVFDVAVDLRKNSSTFGKWVGLELTEENRKMLYIPRGFAHGFCTLTNSSELVYRVDNVYSPDYERGIIWNDKNIHITWPIEKPFLSIKDKNNMSLEDFLKSK